jgi:peptide/nickel transport system permease protein
MWQYIVRRIIGTVPVILVIALVVFLLLHLTGGDPAAIIAGDHATSADIQAIREKLGMERPLPEQFLLWLANVIRGDLGISIFNQVPVATLIVQRLEPTLMLTISVITFSIICAIPLGLVSAWFANTWIDRVVMAIAVGSFSLPVFVIGYALVFGLSLNLGWFPVQGYRSITGGVGPFLLHIALPTVSLGLVYTALLARMTRSSFLEVLDQDYMRTARAKGVTTLRLVLRHGLKNAAVPIVTTIGSGIAVLIGGVVVTESVFAIPGIGRLTVDALLRNDFPVIQGVVLTFSLFYVALNLLIDLSYTLLDPRIRY